MNALADERVGAYLNEYFVSASQKVGTFRIINNEKIGGNVASYFCRLVEGELHVIHCIPGPVDAKTFLSEARFAVELHNQAMLVGAKSWHKYGVTIQNGFRDRVLADGGTAWGKSAARHAITALPAGSRQSLIHETLAKSTLPKLAAFYQYVWKKVLMEKLSAAPVGIR